MVIEVFATTIIITNYHADGAAAAATAAVAAASQQLKLGVSIENKNETHHFKPSRQFEIKLHFFGIDE